MTTKKWEDLTRKRFSTEKRAELDARVRDELLEMSLREVREMIGKTQVEVAASASIPQAVLSREERREDHRISTVRRYVEALGGELEVVAVFGNKRVRLCGV